MLCATSGFITSGGPSTSTRDSVEAERFEVRVHEIAQRDAVPIGPHQKIVRAGKTVDALDEIERLGLGIAAVIERAPREG